MEAEKSRKPREDGVETREAILSSAEEEFAKRGYEAASVRTICANAGANIALVNRYFNSKESLYKIVAKRLFGDLGAPLASLPEKATDEDSWRTAVREWVDDMLFMALPTKRSQKLCRGLFRHEVVSPTKFHAEFREMFGRPVYDGLRNLLSMKVQNEERLDLLASSVWAQVSVYALANEKWHKSFRPTGTPVRAWADKVRDHICETLFKTLEEDAG